MNRQTETLIAGMLRELRNIDHELVMLEIHIQDLRQHISALRDEYWVLSPLSDLHPDPIVRSDRSIPRPSPKQIG